MIPDDSFDMSDSDLDINVIHLKDADDLTEDDLVKLLKPIIVRAETYDSLDQRAHVIARELIHGILEESDEGEGHTDQ